MFLRASIFKVFLGEALSPVTQGNLNPYSCVRYLVTPLSTTWLVLFMVLIEWFPVYQGEWPPPSLLMNTSPKGFILRPGDQHWISMKIIQENDYWAPRPQLIRKLVTLVTLESPVLQLPNGAMIPSPGDQCGRLHSTSLDPPVLLTARRPCPLNLLGSDAALLCQGHSASTTVGAIRTLLRLIHTCHCLFVTKRCHVC